MSKKFISVLIAFSIVVSSFIAPISSYASQVDYNEDTSYLYDEAKLADELSNYFERDKNGNVSFTADKETLMKLGFSENDSELMTSMNLDDSNVITHENEVSIQRSGYVSIRLNFGPKIRAMSGVAAGAFAGGFVAFYLKELALMGPVGAGAAAAITAVVAYKVSNAVENGLTYLTIGVVTKNLNWSKTINIP